MNLQSHETCVLIPIMWPWGFQDIHEESIRCSPHGKIQNKYKESIVIHVYKESWAIVGLVNMCNFMKFIWVKNAITTNFLLILSNLNDYKFNLKSQPILVLSQIYHLFV
jgi:hypothetical protein